MDFTEEDGLSSEEAKTDPARQQQTMAKETRTRSMAVIVIPDGENATITSSERQ
jgi:hypothetical protein